LRKKNQIFAHARRDRDKGGRKADADQMRERGRGRRERESVCGTAGKSGAGRGNGGRWGWGFLDGTPSPPCTATPSYGRGGGSVARRGTIHTSTASDGDFRNA